MRTLTILWYLTLAVSLNGLRAQTVVKMELPAQADQPLTVVALFDEEIPEGIPVVLGLMGYQVEGGNAPYHFEWLLNGLVVSTTDVAIFTPKKGDDLVLKVTDNTVCSASTAFNLKVASLPENDGNGNNQSIAVYPTVVKQELFVEFPQTGLPALVRIFSLSGVVVYETFLAGNGRLDLNLASGTYFVSVKAGDLHKVEKILVP